VRLLERDRVLGQVELSNIGRGLSAYPFMLVLEQSRNEQLMYDWLKSYEPRGALANGNSKTFSQKGGAVTAHVKNGSGASQTIEGKYLVGCDDHTVWSGARSVWHLKAAHLSVCSTLPMCGSIGSSVHDALTVCLAPHGVVASFRCPGKSVGVSLAPFPKATRKMNARLFMKRSRHRIKEDAELELDYHAGRLVFDLQGPYAGTSTSSLRQMFCCRATRRTYTRRLVGKA